MIRAIIELKHHDVNTIRRNRYINGTRSSFPNNGGLVHEIEHSPEEYFQIVMEFFY